MPQAGSPPTKRPKLPQSVKLALFTFLLAGAFVVAALPGMLHSTASAPPFSLFLIAGLAIIVLTGLLFAYLGTLGLGFGKTALTLALGYNLVIVLIKIVMSPYALYVANRNGGFGTSLSDPNTTFFYVVTGGLILLLYVLAFSVIYRHFVKRLQRRQGTTTKKAYAKTVKRMVIILSVVLVAAVLSGGAVLLFPLLFLGSPLDYLSYVFGVLGLPLMTALALAIYLAYRGFAAVEQQAFTTRNATLLASFFWLGLSLILLYHIMWIVFMVTLVNLWPFSTYTAK